MRKILPDIDISIKCTRHRNRVTVAWIIDQRKISWKMNDLYFVRKNMNLPPNECEQILWSYINNQNSLLYLR